MIYFTSDLHFGHALVTATRGFGPKCNNINKLRKSMTKQDFEQLCNIKKHDERIIKNINAMVGKQDELYILGDIAAGTQSNFDYTMNMLDKLYVPANRRHLILGNHENFKLRDIHAYALAKRFATISCTEFITIENHQFVLAHLPHQKYMTGKKLKQCTSNALAKELKKYAPNVPENITLLHGHTHSKEIFNFPNDTQSIHVGLDAWKLKPVSEKQILALLKTP